MSIRRGALPDLLDGLLMWRLWLRMGWMDIVRRYRRTTIGPFWTTLGVGVFVGTSGFMYAGVFKQDLTNYLPFLSTGFAVWVPISTYLNECSSVLAGQEGIVKQTRLPYSVFIYAGIVRNTIVFFHHMTVFVVVALVVRMEVNANMLFAIPAMVLFVVNGVWAGIVVSVICARFRDMQQVVANLLLMIFFMTPIFWPADSVRGMAQAALVDWNIFHHFVDILRQPLLGKQPSYKSWAIVLVTTVVGWLLAIGMMRRYRHRIVFWM